MGHWTEWCGDGDCLRPRGNVAAGFPFCRFTRHFFGGICMMISAWAEIVFSVIVASRSRPRNQLSGGD